MTKIGDIELKSNVILAPMAGYTDAAFRSICTDMGAALTYTEMISAKALYYKNKNTKPLLRVMNEREITGLQLFGNEPELMASEAAKLEDGPYAFFDVNMACPVAKVVNNGEGSALMREPEKVGKIVKALTRTLKKPVTIKIRKGFSEEDANAVLIAKIAEDNGASAIAIHGRTREQFYNGIADYKIIADVKKAVKIPVFGSGDIFSRADYEKMISETGVDAVMAARGARGNPWIFKELADPGFEKPDIEEIKKMIFYHLELMLESEDEYSAVRQMRKHVGFYVTGYKNAALVRREINTCETADEFRGKLTLWKA